MNNRDYRELQFSSSQLVFIFLGILILGVVIFLLGVSVGKKQAQIVSNTDTAPKQEIEEVIDKTPRSPKKPKDSISKELASHQRVKKESRKQATLPGENNLYYIQVGAFKEKERAIAFSQKFRGNGYDTLVLDPLPKDSKPVFRVRIGGFKSKEKAEEVRKSLKSPTKKRTKYFIIKQ